MVYVYSMSNEQTNGNMTTFLVTSNKGTSEWMNGFIEVQRHMNELEKAGTVSNVRVQKFSNMVLDKEITYNYNGESWEK